MIDTTRRAWHVLRKPQGSIYVRCPNCLMSGVNFPGDPVCGNCGCRACIEYFPCGVPQRGELYAWLYRRLFGNGLAYRGRNWWRIADWLKARAQ